MIFVSCGDYYKYVSKSKLFLQGPCGVIQFSQSGMLVPDCILVYRWCMSRTNIDIDEKACAAVMRRYQFSTKREAVNFALQALATEPFSLDEARKLRGSGWEGDLDEMRAKRIT